jgi:hypothetical protein
MNTTNPDEGEHDMELEEPIIDNYDMDQKEKNNEELFEAFRDYCIKNINNPKGIFKAFINIIRQTRKTTLASNKKYWVFNSDFIEKILPITYINVYKVVLKYIFDGYFNTERIICGRKDLDFYDIYVNNHNSTSPPTRSAFKNNFTTNMTFDNVDDIQEVKLLTRAIIVLIFKYKNEPFFNDFADFFKNTILTSIPDGNWNEISNCLYLPENIDSIIRSWRSENKYSWASSRSASRVGKSTKKFFGFGGKKSKKGKKIRKTRKNKKNRKSRK